VLIVGNKAFGACSERRANQGTIEKQLETAFQHFFIIYGELFTSRARKYRMSSADLFVLPIVWGHFLYLSLWLPWTVLCKNMLCQVPCPLGFRYDGS